MVRLLEGSLLFCLATALAACASGSTAEGGDGTLDPGSVRDAGSDSARDTSRDTVTDDGRDVGRDSGSDTQADSSRDDTLEATDSGGDNAVDATDTRPDTTPTACGNGTVEAGEACDDGVANSGTRPDACRPDCTEARCGDGVVDSGEGCDDGNSDGSDGCGNDCTAAATWVCTSCAADADCGGPDDNCVRLADGLRCLQACDAASDCGSGFNCVTPAGSRVRQCVPTSNACSDCVDGDRDGYGVGASCTGPDCNDANASVNPGSAEVCDLVDNDCDGSTDEGLTTSSYWRDADGDGRGAAGAAPQSFCANPGGFASTDDDCNDADAGDYPGATERCDGRDNNCNGAVDDGASLSTFWLDGDSDGAGNAAVTAQGCSAPVGYVANDDDCDDANPGRRPGAREACDGVDNDCSGTADDNGASCPCPIYFYSGHTYLFCNELLTWTDAQARCASVGYNLVTVDSDAENNAVLQVWNVQECGESCRDSGDGYCDDGGPNSSYSICDLGSDCSDCGSYGSRGLRAWIGFNDRGTEGSWAWPGAGTGYTNWNGGEPNDAGAGEDCGEVYLGGRDSGRWNDVECSATKLVTCESL
jgi:cysteine-rich repeat protein